ncbi:MAG: efflux transporter outer rane subunit [Chlamydiales bacterium]|nr:efflux transporter outer rane subunit [Chlamydiales bacterium]
MDLPKEWSGRLQVATSDSKEIWWEGFKDHTLSKLIEKALQNNSDLLIATARLEQARAALNLAKSDKFPELNLKGSGGRTATNKDLATSRANRISNQFNLAVVLDFELDLWKKLANAEEAERQRLLALEKNQEAIKLCLVCDVIISYFNFLAIDNQIKCLQQTVAIQHQQIKLKAALLKLEALSRLEWQQGKIELEAAQAQIPQLQQQKIQYQSALSVLVGATPREIFEEEVIIQELSCIPKVCPVPNILPSKLLENRADIVAAELNLKASCADIAVAKAAYFPQLSLTGLIGLTSDKVDHLFRNNSKSWSAGADIGLPLLDFGRTRSNLDKATAYREETLENYKKTVRIAFQEVIDALNAQANSNTYYNAKQNQLQACQEAYMIAQQRYDAGYSNYSNLLSARELLLNSEIENIQANNQLLAATVSLYKALGGSLELEKSMN